MVAAQTLPLCSPADPRGQEATWEALVPFFDTFRQVNPEWQGRREQVHLYYILKIYYRSGRLAGDFVHSRYVDPGQRLWYCRYLDPPLAKEARRRALFG